MVVILSRPQCDILPREESKLAPEVKLITGFSSGWSEASTWVLGQGWFTWWGTLKDLKIPLYEVWMKFITKLNNWKQFRIFHYSDVIMSIMVSHITSISTVYSTVYSGTDQRNHQSSASLAFVRGIYWWPVNSPHKGPVMWKMFPFHDVIIDFLHFMKFVVIHYKIKQHHTIHIFNGIQILKLPADQDLLFVFYL